MTFRDEMLQKAEGKPKQQPLRARMMVRNLIFTVEAAECNTLVWLEGVRKYRSNMRAGEV
jgi:hypothetical protein